MIPAIKSKYLNNKVALVTGGTTGLGLILARKLIKENCLVSICARDASDLQKAKAHLSKNGGDVRTYVCDVSKSKEVEEMIKDLVDKFGRIDLIINNAGIIQVGPMETFTLKQYQEAMDVMYWGIVNTTLAALPYMKERKAGHIANVTSIGGKVSVPHLLPYSASKFAAVGFSQGAAAELKKDKIVVTTLVPWLMRTGSHINAYFQKDNRKEFKLFSFMATAPFMALSAEKAADIMIKAIKKKKTLKVIGFKARLAIEFNHFFPEFTSSLFGIVSRFIPSSDKLMELERGEEIKNHFADTEVVGVKKIGDRAESKYQDLH